MPIFLRDGSCLRIHNEKHSGIRLPLYFILAPKHFPLFSPSCSQKLFPQTLSLCSFGAHSYVETNTIVSERFKSDKYWNNIFMLICYQKKMFEWILRTTKSKSTLASIKYFFYLNFSAASFKNFHWKNVNCVAFSDTFWMI